MAVCIYITHQRESKVLFYCDLCRSSLLLANNCAPILVIFSYVHYTADNWLYAEKARVNVKYFESTTSSLVRRF